MPTADDFETALRAIRTKDARYSRNAYIFAFQSLEYTIKDFLKLTKDEHRHVSAAELLNGMRQLAIDQFGFMARHVWESWGVHETEDWGNIIYNLIEGELMRHSDDDKRSDFTGVYDFADAFDKEWKFV